MKYTNIMHRFDTHAEYKARLQELVERGERVCGMAVATASEGGGNDGCPKPIGKLR